MSRGQRSRLIGYCTNVHAGTDKESILANLRKCAVPVRTRLGLSELGVGLWFSQRAAVELQDPNELRRFGDELAKLGLIAYTINGFPQEDFHQRVVKHRVYHPAWWEQSRLDYTKNLVHLLDNLLPGGMSGSISTLPIGWGADLVEDKQGFERSKQAAVNLLTLAQSLHELFETTGRKIRLALEPEPGCIFTDNGSLRDFFERYLSAPAIHPAQEALAREYLTVCHDVCHSAVMGEDQREELVRLSECGIQVGKVQVSSAIRVPWDRLDSKEQRVVLQQLSEFAEDRYLHQTMVVNASGDSQLYEDLPMLLKPYFRGGLLDEHATVTDRQWRIHFHVPIYVPNWGQIETTQSQIIDWLELTRRSPEMLTCDPAYEVETYAWGVLPPDLRRSTLDEGIADEIAWLTSKI